MNESLKKWYDKGFLETDQMLCYEHIKQLEAIATNIGRLADAANRIAEHGIPPTYRYNFVYGTGGLTPQNVTQVTETAAKLQCNATP